MDINELVGKYESNRKHYLSNKYNESQLRVDFLNPLFSGILGWDITNQQGKPVYEREVLVEESLRDDASSKKPDYTFRLLSERKFFLEAKKPSIQIQNDTESCLQLRRYGFTGRLKISILSNFEYLAIYDCSSKVNISDDSQNSRVHLYHYKEYASSLDEIKKQIGRESVYNGEFDVYWKGIEEKVQKTGIDQVFLEQINLWRVHLGNSILSKIDVDEQTLNDLVQKCINSLIFLRVCEDRNFETYRDLLKLQDSESIIKKIQESDKKYNANLFSNHLLNEVIKSSSDSFLEIINQLYYPQSIYSFSVFSSDILGEIYEIFLTKKLVIIDGNQVELRLKDKNIDTDIVTTPKTIISNILKDTILIQCKDKTDKEIFNYKVADICCGSGGFLIEAYKILVGLLIDFYLKNGLKENLIEVSVNAYKLTYDLKQKLLLNCFFGVDQDFNAVESCKFGLLLQLFEDEQIDTVTKPILPSLDNVICFGNSLIDSSMSQEIQFNPFDWANKKFDAIIGNPPYLETKKMIQQNEEEYNLYKKYYKTAYKQFDKYYIFIERSLSLLSEKGILSFIIPIKFAKVGAGKKLRDLIKSHVKNIVSFEGIQIFKNKTTYTSIVTFTKKETKNFLYSKVKDFHEWNMRNPKGAEAWKIEKNDMLISDSWIFVPEKLRSPYDKIINQSIRLEDLVSEKNIYNGVQTSGNDIFIHSFKKIIKEDKNFYYINKNNVGWKIEKTITKLYYKTSSETSLSTYRFLTPNAFIIYPYNENGELISANALQSDYPFAYNYLLAHKSKLEKRDVSPKSKANDEWHGYGRQQAFKRFNESEKIVVGVLKNQGSNYSIDKNQTIFSSGGTAGYCAIALPAKSSYSIFYIQAILSSKYLEWVGFLHGEIFRGNYIALGSKNLKNLPIRKIDFQKPEDNNLHNDIVKIQKNLIEEQKKIDENQGNERLLKLHKNQFTIYKTQLQDLLKKLYNLSDIDDSAILQQRNF